MEIKINLHVSADASVTAALMAFAAAMAGQMQATVPATTKAVIPQVTNPEPTPVPQVEPTAEAPQVGPTATAPQVGPTAEAPQVEPTAEEIFAMVEAELSKLPTGLLMDVIREHTDVNPDDLPGKNTNAKLRKIILDWQAQPQTVEPQTVEPQGVDPVLDDEPKVPTREEFRMLMVPRIQAKDASIKMAAIKAIKDTGFASIDDMYTNGTDEDKLRAMEAVLKIKV